MNKKCLFAVVIVLVSLICLGAVRTFLAVLPCDNRQISQLLQHINLAVGEGSFKGKAFPGVFVQLN